MTTQNSINSPLPTTVPNGGTGVASTTAYAVICGGTTSTGALQPVSGVGTAAQVLTSNGAGALPTWQAAGGGGGGMTWNNIAGTTQAAAVSNGYIVGNASQTTITLPATAALGSLVSVQGKGAAGWILAANTGQTIQMGATATTSGGSFTSAAQYDNIQVVCITANTTWAVLSALSSGLTAA